MQSPTTHDAVHKLLGELRSIALVRQIPRIDEISDSIETLTRAYSMDGINGRVMDDIVFDYHFTPIQRRIFAFLYGKLGRPVTFSALFDAIYFDRAGELPETDILKVFIFNLRKKIAKSEYRIETERGLGFRMVEKERD